MRSTSLFMFTIFVLGACNERENAHSNDSTADASRANEQSDANVENQVDAHTNAEPSSASPSGGAASQDGRLDAGALDPDASESKNPEVGALMPADAAFTPSEPTATEASATPSEPTATETSATPSEPSGTSEPNETQIIDAGTVLGTSAVTQAAEGATNVRPENDAGTEAGASFATTRWLAFQVEMVSDGSRPLFLRAVPNGSAAQQVAPHVASFQWSADGKRLLYWTASVDGSSNGAYVAMLDDEGFSEPTLIHEPLGEGARVKFAGLSPNGHTLALQVFEEDTTRWYVRSIDAASDAWTLVGYGAAGEHDPDVGKFAWSPDGSRAAIVEVEDEAYQRLLLVDEDGEWIDQSYQDLFLVQWANDSSAVLVQGLDDESLGTRALSLVDAESGGVTLAVSDPAIHGMGWDAFSMSKVAPDNAAVAFGANSGDDFDLFVKQDGSAEPAVMLDGRLLQQFDWFPDSTRLHYWGYSLQDEDGPHLYSAPAVGGTLAKLNPAGTLAHCNSGDCIKRSGSSLVFTSLDVEQTRNQLYDLDLTGGSLTPRVLSNYAEGVFIDDFRPNANEQVLTIVTKADGEHELAVIDRTSESPTPRVITTMSAGAYPSAYAAPWSSDSRYFVFRANHDLDVDGNSDLFIGEVTTEGYGISEPVTSNDGSFYLSEPKWQP